MGLGLGLGLGLGVRVRVGVRVRASAVVACGGSSGPTSLVTALVLAVADELVPVGGAELLAAILGHLTK